MIDIVQPFWKPINWTSFDVVKKVRSATHVKKVGHAGTLDPFAQGVLVICLGKATKRVAHIQELEKEYEGTIKLGVLTDTLDPTGEIIEHAKVPPLNEGLILAIFDKFVGEIMQIPPMFSALKIGGKRLYNLARRGVTIDREPRPVKIYSIELLEMQEEMNQLRFRVVCGKGTYIRVLASDIARKIGTVGHLSDLTRTRIGDFTGETAMRLDQLASWKPIAA